MIPSKFLLVSALATACLASAQTKTPPKPTGLCAQAAQNVDMAANPGRYDNQVYSVSLSGKVIATHADEPVEHAIIERMSKSWGNCLQATSTNKSGAFSLGSGSSGTYYLRVSKHGYRPVMLKVTVRPTAPGDLVVSLTPET